jgi:hypothetical protein
VNYAKDNNSFLVYLYDWNQSNDQTNSLILCSIHNSNSELEINRINSGEFGYILDVVSKNDSLFILESDYLFFYIIKNKEYILNKKLAYRKFANIDQIFKLNDESLLLANSYNCSQSKFWKVFDKIRFYTLDLNTWKIKRVKKIKTKPNIGMLYAYNSGHQWIDTRYNKILLADPMDLKLTIYNDDFQLIRKIQLERSTICSTKDSLEKYFDTPFLKHTRFNPKERIMKLRETNAYYFERIEKVFFASDDLIGISKTLPSLKQNERQLLFYSILLDQIVYE